MTREEFEKLVTQAIEGLPEKFLDRLDNIVIMVESWPSPQTLQHIGVRPRGLLFGLYQGTPKTKRTKGTVFPDKITIFAGPILVVSRTKDDVRNKVSSVVKHEIAHHFGLDEASIRKTGH